MIKLLVFDFDGVFTDGKIIFDNNDNILKSYNIKDGKGLSLLKDRNIKIGLLSNFNTYKNIIINNKSLKNLIDHLKFDKWYIGKANKMTILNKWLNELDLSYQDIGYMGDDLNDLDILKKVKISGCPNDAITEVKECVDYICNKNGGKGCIREFIDYILNPKDNLIREIRKELNYNLDNINYKKIDEIVKKINTSSKNIYTLGIGKSGNVAKHLSDLLKSISIKCFNLDSVNLLHGDIGCINQNIILLFSKSGNTKEIIDLIPFLRIRKCYLIGIYCDDDSSFEKLCDLTIKLPLNSEIGGEINKIPTNSIIYQIIFINILISKLKLRINLTDYKLNHPAGIIGTSLLKIKDSLIEKFPKVFIEKKLKLFNILFEMTKYKKGCCFFCDNEERLLGILSDGDIRRLLLKEPNKIFVKKEDLNKNYYFEENLEMFLVECKKVKYIPILKAKKIIGIIEN